MFRDMFGDSDEEEDFSGFELEEIEEQYNNEDGVGIVDERDDEEIRRVVGVEDLQWSREAGHIDLPVFAPSFGPLNFPTLQSALGFFLLFFRLESFEHIVEQTNLYAVQENAEKAEKDPDWFDKDGNAIELTVEELKAFIGIQMMMGIVHLPTMRSYWNEQEPFLYEPEIAKVFPRNRFLSILRYIHLNDNTNLPPKDDPSFKLYRVQPLLNFVKEFCLHTFLQYFPIEKELALHR